MGIAAGLALANTYTSIVDVPAWGNDIPTSLEITRQYYQYSNPGDFFRIFSPANQLLGLLSVILFWKHSRQMRQFLIAAFVLYVIGEGMTFMYFYPRNDIMFRSDIADVEKLKTTWQQWRGMNWIRTLVIASGFICSALALHFSYVASKVVVRSNKTSYVSNTATAIL